MNSSTVVVLMVMSRPNFAFNIGFDSRNSRRWKKKDDVDCSSGSRENDIVSVNCNANGELMYSFKLGEGMKQNKTN